jgi:hypothetical protein
MLPATLTLIEVKGAGDAVRDEQAWWFHQLRGADVPVELWSVTGRES